MRAEESRQRDSSISSVRHHLTYARIRRRVVQCVCAPCAAAPAEWRCGPRKTRRMDKAYLTTVNPLHARPQWGDTFVSYIAPSLRDQGAMPTALSVAGSDA